MYLRILKLDALLKVRSYFLFGPRATGKSTLIHQTLPNAKVYDLLEANTFSRLLRKPGLLAEETSPSDWVVIDEIQKLPSLLDEVHRLIQQRQQRFLLTGSSARKLKRGAANLLAGRAFKAELFPLTSHEINEFNLLTYLNTTGLPEFYGSDLASDFLEAYVGTYLQEEIQAESLTRDLPGFTRFLEVVALSNGAEINFASVSSDTGVNVKTVANYFSILEDTLTGFPIPPFKSTRKRKAITRSKFFLFDIGVVNWIAKRSMIEEKSELFGYALEHFIVLELRAYLAYRKKRQPLQYWRSVSGFEVDLVAGNQLALEIKATDLVKDKHLKGLRALKEEGLIRHYGAVSLDAETRKTEDSITIWPVHEFLRLLWADQIL